jgi:chemotaxis protein methyltransferase CheR
MREFGYPDISDALFKQMTGLLFQESGITLREGKKYLFLNRLSKVVGEDKTFTNFEDYYQALLGDKSKKLLSEFINLLTTNFSFFFREDLHFNFLKQYLRENAKKEPYIRFWSAASSTGEEAYSIAISCLQTLGSPIHGDLKILASDISTRVLERARNGNYHYTQVRGHIEDNELKKFFDFDKDSNDFLVKDEIKRMVAFRYLNLIEFYPFKKNFDIVFLRNVLIYFGDREREIVINKIYDYVKPGGYLILGLSESLAGIRNPFQSMKNSIYQKK